MAPPDWRDTLREEAPQITEAIQYAWQAGRVWARSIRAGLPPQGYKAAMDLHCSNTWMPEPPIGLLERLHALLGGLELCSATVNSVKEYGDVVPVVPAAVVATQIYAFCRPARLADVAMRYPEVIEKGEWYRVFTSAWTHGHVPHICNNLAVAVPDMLYLQQQSGSSLALAADVLGLTVLSGGIEVGLAWLGAALFGQGFWFFSPGVGFSGVVYALRVVASHSKDGGAERHGWGKLLYTSQVQAANVGFLAHLSGVLTGQVRLHLVPPVGRVLVRGVALVDQGLEWLTGAELELEEQQTRLERRRRRRDQHGGGGGGGGGGLRRVGLCVLRVAGVTLCIAGAVSVAGVVQDIREQHEEGEEEGAGVSKRRQRRVLPGLVRTLGQAAHWVGMWPAKYFT